MAALKVGSIAPEFALPTGEGKTLALSDLRGKIVVLYFYPKDNTSGCTKEACDFRDNLAALKKKKVVVVGVSPDSAASHAKFAGKFDLSFPLVSDVDKTLVKAYGVWKEKSMYGRKYMGIERTTFVIGVDGLITHIFPKVKVAGHVAEVIEAVKGLS
jgi:thioredoxin-dependent peroxiredoxin